MLAKSKLIASISFLLVLLTGCSTVKPYQPTEGLSSEHVVDQWPNVGEVATATVGSSMVRVKDYYVSTTKTNSLELVSRPAGDSFWQGASIGQKYPIRGRMERNGVNYLLAVCVDEAMSALTCIHINPNTLVAEGFGNSLVFTKRGAAARFKHEVIEEVSTSSGFTNFELVYSGTSNNVLRLKYREYSPDDLARPAFFQDLTYSLEDSSIFFKEIELEILEANNRGVRYVLKRM